MVAAAGCVQASHAVYYGFSTLHWQAYGHSETVVGLLWAEGVIAEIILFGTAAPLVRRLGPERLLALAGLAGIVRWSALALTDWLPALAVFQALHAFSFGAAHLGAMHFMGRTMPPHQAATAQSLYSVAVIGIAVGLATGVSGTLYQAWGAGAYWWMAVLGGFGMVLAHRLGALR
jgi:PPP family 3-phenylpropionic acid transporter